MSRMLIILGAIVIAHVATAEEPKAPASIKSTSKKPAPKQIVDAISKAFRIDARFAAEIAEEHKPKHCAVKAGEVAADNFVIPQSNCHGTRWSDAYPGVCITKDDPAAWCISDALKTRVTIHEYSLAWDATAKKCVITATGAKDTVEVNNCGGPECGS